MKGLTRWLLTEGRMGEAPSWYGLVQAARYLRVPPWDLAEKPQWWTSIALAAMNAEGQRSKQSKPK